MITRFRVEGRLGISIFVHRRQSQTFLARIRRMVDSLALFLSLLKLLK